MADFGDDMESVQGQDNQNRGPIRRRQGLEEEDSEATLEGSDIRENNGPEVNQPPPRLQEEHAYAGAPPAPPGAQPGQGRYRFRDPRTITWPAMTTDECRDGKPMRHHWSAIQRFKQVVGRNLANLHESLGKPNPDGLPMMDNEGILYVHQTGTGKTNLVLWLMNICAACRIPFRIVTTATTLGKYKVRNEDFMAQASAIGQDMNKVLKTGGALWAENKTHWQKNLYGDIKSYRTDMKNYDQITFEEITGSQDRITKTYLENNEGKGEPTPNGKWMGTPRRQALLQPHVLFIDEMHEIMMQYTKEKRARTNIDDFLQWCTKKIAFGIDRRMVIIVGFTATPGSTYSELQTLLNCVAKSGHFFLNQMDGNGDNPLQQGLREGCRQYIDYADLTYHPRMTKPQVTLNTVLTPISESLLHSAFLYKDMQCSCSSVVRAGEGISLKMLSNMEAVRQYNDRDAYKNTMLSDMDLTGDKSQTTPQGLRMEFLSSSETDATAGAMCGMIPIAYYSEALGEMQNSRANIATDRLGTVRGEAPGNGPGCRALKQRVRGLFEMRQNNVANTIEAYLRYVARNDIETKSASVGAKMSKFLENVQNRTTQLKQANSSGMSIAYIRDEVTATALFELLEWVSRRKASLVYPQIFSQYKIGVWSAKLAERTTKALEQQGYAVDDDQQDDAYGNMGLNQRRARRRRTAKAGHYRARRAVPFDQRDRNPNNRDDDEDYDERQRIDAAKVEEFERWLKHSFVREEGDIIFIRMKDILQSTHVFAERLKDALARPDWFADAEKKHIVLVLAGRDEGVGLSFPYATEMHVLDCPPSRSIFLQLMGRPLRLCANNDHVNIHVYHSIAANSDPKPDDENSAFLNELLVGQRCFQYNKFIITKPFDDVDTAPFRFQQNIVKLCAHYAEQIMEYDKTYRPGGGNTRFSLSKKPVSVRKVVYSLLPYYLAMEFWPVNSWINFDTLKTGGAPPWPLHSHATGTMAAVRKMNRGQESKIIED